MSVKPWELPSSNQPVPPWELKPSHEDATGIKNLDPLVYQSYLNADIAQGLLYGAAKAVDNTENMIRSSDAWLNSLFSWGDNTYTRSSLASHVDQPETGVGKVAELVPALAAGYATGGAAEAGLLASLGEVFTGTALRRLGLGALVDTAGSAGYQVAESGKFDPKQAAKDVFLGQAFRSGGEFWGLVKKIIPKHSNPDVMAAADRVGVNPSLAMMTDGTVSKFTEKAMEAFPGSSGVMKRFNDANQESLNEFVDGLAKNIHSGGSASSTSVILPTPVEIGDNLAEAFAKYSRDTSENASRYFDEAVSRSGAYRIKPTDTLKLLNELEKTAKNNPGIEGIIVSSDMRKLAKGIRGQAQQGLDLPGAIKLKSSIRNMMDNPGSGLKPAEEAELAWLSHSLEEDIQRDIHSNNAPFGVAGAYSEANTLWKQRMDEIKSMGQALNSGLAGDQLYARIFGNPANALMQGQVAQMKAILSYMPEAVANEVRSEIVRRAALQAAGAAGNEGRKFSADTFLTNWTKLKDNGVADFFEAGHREDLDALALVSERQKALNRSGNHSGTDNIKAPAKLWTMGLGAAGALASGSPHLAALAVAPIPLSYMGAKAMTNPRMVRWLTDASKLSEEPELWPMLGRLVALWHSEPELRDDISLMADNEGQPEVTITITGGAEDLK